jgi:hypothetical protein
VAEKGDEENDDEEWAQGVELEHGGPRWKGPRPPVDWVGGGGGSTARWACACCTGSSRRTCWARAGVSR